MSKFSIFDIEKNGTGIEKNGTGIEKGGTGIEKGGTGIEKGGTGIEKGGTGRRALGRLRFAAFGMALGAFMSTSAMAAPSGLWEDWGDLGGTVQFGVKAGTLTASWSTFDKNGNPMVLLGTAQTGKDVVNMTLYKVMSGYHGSTSEPMPFLKQWGHATLDFDGCGNAHGSVSIVKIEGSGTGNKIEGSGTGNKIEGSGTGNKIEGSGTGNKIEGSGTGNKIEGSGTGNKLAYYGDVVLVGPGKSGGCQ